MRYRNTFIIIEQDLFHHLETCVSEYNRHYSSDDPSKISMDIAVFFLNYIRLKSIQYKDKLVHGYVRLHSKFLNDYLKDQLKKYRTFLTEKGYIKTIPYNTDEGKSIGYKVVSLDKIKASQRRQRKYVVYDFINRTYEDSLNKQLEKHERSGSRKRSANRTTRHLTKWLSEDHIQIDWENAFRWIDENKKLSDEKKYFYSYAVERIRFEQWLYSRSGKDNRLHSNLTNLPSDLRKFITITNTDKLVSLDIRSSQPFLLAGVFNLLITDKDMLFGLASKLKHKTISDIFISIMNLISLESLIITDFKTYINLVCNSDIYNHVAGSLDEKFVESIELKSIDGKFRDKVYNPTKGLREEKDFEDLRTYCKTLTLEYMYCSTENNLERIEQIKQAYPKAVNDFIHDFKYCKELEVPKSKRTKKQREKIKKAKKSFPQFLQQLEAGIMLDTITKEISKMYPYMFMATIHDSIVIPKKYEDKVKPYFRKRLFEIFGIEPEIKSEDW